MRGADQRRFWFNKAGIEGVAFNESIKLIEMPEDHSISVCVYNEDDGIFQLGERINERFEEAYMNGYNWDALIRFYIGGVLGMTRVEALTGLARRKADR